jgi:hypothetical protein
LGQNKKKAFLRSKTLNPTDLDGTTLGIDIVVRKKLALYGPYGTKLWLTLGSWQKPQNPFKWPYKTPKLIYLDSRTLIYHIEMIFINF